jgi:hypothetical protein
MGDVLAIAVGAAASAASATFAFLMHGRLIGVGPFI